MEPEPQSTSEADAAHTMAIKAAEGIGAPQNWTVALDHLQHSAQLGSCSAQAELAADYYELRSQDALKRLFDSAPGTIKIKGLADQARRV